MKRPIITYIVQKHLLLRIAVAAILLMHSVPTILDGSIEAFGTQYLDKVGFAPLGLPLAWAIKLSHIAAAICLLINRFVRIASAITIVILVMGIILLHAKEGWFVLGRGHDGVEFNVLLIMVLLTLIFSAPERN